MKLFALYTSRPPVTALKLKKIEGRYKILTLKLRALNQKGGLATLNKTPKTSYFHKLFIGPTTAHIIGATRQCYKYNNVIIDFHMISLPTPFYYPPLTICHLRHL